MNDRIVTKDTNWKAKLYKRMIALCWCCLIVCFLIKIFGGNFFVIVCNDKRMIALCEFIDSNIIILSLLQYIVYLVGTTLYLQSLYNVPFSRKGHVITLLFITLAFIIKFILTYINANTILILICEFLVVVILPLFFKTKIKNAVLGCLIIYLFSFISNITKDIGSLMLPNYSLIALIMMIDYYIMLMLMYLYSKQLKRR